MAHFPILLFFLQSYIVKNKQSEIQRNNRLCRSKINRVPEEYHIFHQQYFLIQLNGKKK